MNQRYQFTPRDAELLWAANLLLRKVMASGKVRPAQMVTLAKLHHILTMLPRVTETVTASVSVCSPRRKFGEIETFHWWDFGVEGEVLKITSGGHYYHPSTGGDTFTAMTWGAVPALPPEFDDFSTSLSMVPDLRSYLEGVESIDFTAGEYKIEILDLDNPLLEECLEDDPEGDEAEEELQAQKPVEPTKNEEHPEVWTVTPIDASEKWLASHVDPQIVESREPAFGYNVKDCDICGCVLDQHGLYVDGRLRDDLMWSNMCVDCFKDNGEGIGWGKGQLYARQPDGRWRLVAGFPPDDEL